jgi:hypothetical protein
MHKLVTNSQIVDRTCVRVRFFLSVRGEAEADMQDERKIIITFQFLFIW